MAKVGVLYSPKGVNKHPERLSVFALFGHAAARDVQLWALLDIGLRIWGLDVHNVSGWNTIEVKAQTSTVPTGQPFPTLTGLPAGVR